MCAILMIRFFGKCRQQVLAKVSQSVSQSVFLFGALAPFEALASRSILSTARPTAAFGRSPRRTKYTASNIAYIRQIGDALKVNQFALFHPNRVVYTRGRLAVGRGNRVVSSKLGSLY